MALVISFSRFKNPLGLQFPKWKLTWECGGSFLHTFLHSREHEMWLPNFTLGLHLCVVGTTPSHLFLWRYILFFVHCYFWTCQLDISVPNVEWINIDFQVFLNNLKNFPYFFHFFVGIWCIFATKLMKTNLWKLFL